MTNLVKCTFKIAGRFAVLDDDTNAGEDDYKTSLGLVVEFDTAEDLRRALTEGRVEIIHAN